MKSDDQYSCSPDKRPPSGGHWLWRGRNEELDDTRHRPRWQVDFPKHWLGVCLHDDQAMLRLQTIENGLRCISLVQSGYGARLLIRV